jgi:hypothetical protein
LAALIAGAGWLLLWVPRAPAEIKLYDTFQRDYRIRNVDPAAKDGDQRHFFSFCEYSIRAEETELFGRRVVLITREEKTAEGDRQRWQFYLEPNPVKLLRTDQELVTRQGKVLETIRQNYADHFIAFPPNSFPMQLFPYTAQTVKLVPGAAAQVHVIFSPEHKPWEVTLLVDGQETVTVPAGTFSCTRIKVRYQTDDLPGFFKSLPSFLLSRMFPDIWLWVQNQPPYAMVKMQGKLEGFSAPEKVHELVRVHASPGS